MHRLLLLPLLAMTFIPAPLPAQAEPAGAPGSWEWVPLDGHPGRRFRLFVPSTAAADQASPLVVMLHGCTQDPDDLARGSRFNVAAAEHGVVVAYPEQTGAHNPQKCWNWFMPEHQVGGEAAMVGDVARAVMALRPVDPARVYVAGISAGASMALNAAMVAEGLFTAVGAHSGIAYRAASDLPSALAVMRGDDQPLPVLVAAAARGIGVGPPPALLAIQGEADALVSPRNIAVLYVQWAGVHGGGEARDDSLQMGGRRAVRTRHLQSDGGYPVELWRVEGLGHAWSGGSSQGSFADPAGPDASRLMLDFFLSRPRRPTR